MPVYRDETIISENDSNSTLQLKRISPCLLSHERSGTLTYFLGLEVRKTSGGLFINQHRYTLDLIAQARQQFTTPMDAPLKLNVKYRRKMRLLSKPTLCRKLAESITRPDISLTVNLVSPFMTLPNQHHLSTIKRII